MYICIQIKQYVFEEAQFETRDHSIEHFSFLIVLLEWYSSLFL